MKVTNIETDHFLISQSRATTLSNSKGRETQRIHFKDMEDGELICNLAIQRLDGEGIHTDVNGLSSLKNKYWVVMEIGEGEKVLLNRNSAFKRLAQLGIGRAAVEAAFDTHDMNNIQALITQKHVEFAADVGAQFRANVTDYATDNPPPGGESVEDYVNRVCAAILPTLPPLADIISSQRYFQLFLNPDHTELDALKTAVVQQLENGVEAYLENHTLYLQLLNNVVREAEEHCAEYARSSNSTLVDTTIDRTTSEWREQLLAALRGALSESTFNRDSYDAQREQLLQFATEYVEYTPGVFLKAEHILPRAEALPFDLGEDLPV